MGRPLTPDEIDQLSKELTRSKQLHPGFRGAGDPIAWESDENGIGHRVPTVGPRRNVYDLTVRVSVNADAAGRLPGFPGFGSVRNGEEWEVPVTGIDLLLGEAQHAAQEAVDRVLMASPLAADARVSPGPEGGVLFVRIAFETPEDSLF